MKPEEKRKLIEKMKEQLNSVTFTEAERDLIITCLKLAILELND